ncbi:MAG: lipoyl(octanoyl) transferase LipB [Bacteroidales bacterium]
MSYNVVYQDIGLKRYKEAWDHQEEIFKKLVENKTNGQISTNSESYGTGTLIMVEHPHVYTLGKSGSENNLLIDYIQLKARDAEFFKTDRGGDITYHGPGQIVGYPLFDLERIGISLKEYIHRLEEAVIMTIAGFGLSGTRLEGATGVWLDPDIHGKVRKICAIGVKASRYITMHGFAFNVNTDLTYFNYINPCGFTDKGVTSLQKELGEKQDFEELKLQVKNNLREVFDLNWVN